MSVSAAPRGHRAAAAAAGTPRLGEGWLVPAAVALIGLCAVVAYALTYAHYLDMRLYPVVRSDGVGYYAYLPGWLLDHDPSLRTLVTRDLAGQNLDFLGFKLQPATHAYLDRYPVGEAILLLPFFACGHVAALLTGAHADGFSTPEELAVGLGGVAYMVGGLALLAISLRRRFSAAVTAATLVALTFGTNLFHYGTFDSLFSHAFSFFLVAGLVWLTEAWNRDPERTVLSLSIGVCVAMIVLVRNTNIVLVLVPLLHGVVSLETFRRRMALLRSHAAQVVLAGAAALLLVTLQLGAWHIATGSWYVNSYANAYEYGFDVIHPALASTLLSLDPHGLLPWSPVLVLALAGATSMLHRARELVLPTAAIFLITLYLVASWSNWHFGGGYGHRGFVDIYPLLAFGLASFFGGLRTARMRSAAAVVTAGSCALVTVQMLHYWKLLVPFDGASLSEYLRLLTRPVW